MADTGKQGEGEPNVDGVVVAPDPAIQQQYG